MTTSSQPALWWQKQPGWSAAEKSAQRWHEERHRDRGKDAGCWCCCRSCRQINPHLKKAYRAVLADVERRIREASAASRLPPPQRDKAG